MRSREKVQAMDALFAGTTVHRLRMVFLVAAAGSLLTGCATRVARGLPAPETQQPQAIPAPAAVPSPARIPVYPVPYRCIQPSGYFPNFPARYQPALRRMDCILQVRYRLPAQVVLAALREAHFSRRAVDLMTPSPAMVQKPLPWWEYRDRFLRPDRLARGTAFWMSHQKLVAHVAARYGVSPFILMGILNIETGFGTFEGNFPVLDANLSLALGLPGRRQFFLYQTAETLKLSRRLDVPAESLRGSEAGAMGMSQFLASSYLHYGTAWNDPPGGAPPNLWTSVPDVLASTANFFRRHGWQPGQPVLVPAMARWGAHVSFCLQGRHTFRQLLENGIQTKGNIRLPAGLRVGLVRLQTRHGPRLFVACPNFYVVMDYNHSVFYAATVWAYGRAVERKRLG